MTDKLAALSAHFTGEVFKAYTARVRRKLEQALELPRIELGDSSFEGRALR